MSAGTAEVLVPNDDDNYIEEGIKAATEYSNQQPRVDREFAGIVETAKAFEPIEVGEVFPVSGRFGEAVHGVRSRRRGAINSGHLILRYPNLPINHG